MRYASIVFFHRCLHEMFELLKLLLHDPEIDYVLVFIQKPAVEVKNHVKNGGSLSAKKKQGSSDSTDSNSSSDEDEVRIIILFLRSLVVYFFKHIVNVYLVFLIKTTIQPKKASAAPSAKKDESSDSSESDSSEEEDVSIIIWPTQKYLMSLYYLRNFALKFYRKLSLRNVLQVFFGKQVNLVAVLNRIAV